MEMISVQSSNMDKIGYDEVKQELFIRFKNGSTYKYNGVPASIWEELQSSESKGKYLNANVKGEYRFEKVA
jgi:hypothetical protein